MWRYGRYLRANYQDQIMGVFDSSRITSVLEYDNTNNFIYVPIDREIAFDCQRILKDEDFVLRRNIMHNIQASK